MKIAFNQSEIIAGLKLFIQSQGIDLIGKSVTVDFTAGRGATGLSAEVNIDSDGSKSAGSAEVTKSIEKTIGVATLPTEVTTTVSKEPEVVIEGDTSTPTAPTDTPEVVVAEPTDTTEADVTAKTPTSLFG